MDHQQTLDKARNDLSALTRRRVSFDGAAPTEALLVSRVGGPAMWPRDRELPVGENGETLHFALQIDLGDAPELPDFPRAGVMQLFLADSILERGITYSAAHRQPGYYPLRRGDGFFFAVHDDVSLLEARPQGPSDDEFPVLSPEARERGIALGFGEVEAQQVPASHWLGAAIYETLEALEKEDDSFDLAGAAEELWPDLWSGGGNFLGGYAHPMQLDHRFFFEEFRRYDRCILNVQDLPGLETSELNLSVLINGEDLAAGRYDDVILMADTD